MISLEGRRVTRLQAAALLVAMTLLAYLPALQAGFIWDDDSNVINNPGLARPDGLARIWTDFHATQQQYYPLTYTTFWIERRLWGLSPFGYHLNNVLLHAGSAVLLWLALGFLRAPGAWLAGAIFALHPVHVESVAWVTERKNTLSCFFMLASVLLFLRAVLREEGPAGGWRPKVQYALSVALFAVALLAKTAVSPLPVGLAAVVWWKRGRLAPRDLLLLFPFFALGLGFGLFTARLERLYVGAVGDEFRWSPATHLLVAGRAFWFYLSELLWPVDLVFVRPRWVIRPAEAAAWLYPLAAAALLPLLAGLVRRLGRAPLAAGVWFSALIFPALGFFNVYFMRYAFVQDHFEYFAGIAVIALAAGTVAVLTERLARSGFALVLPRVGAALPLLLLVTLGLLTWRQAHSYRDAETLWRDTLAKNPGSALANLNYGSILFERGDLAAAQRHFERALVEKPEFGQAWYNLGMALMKREDFAAAVRALTTAVRLDPSNARAYENLGVSHGEQGNHAEAAEFLARAVRLEPGNPSAWGNLGAALAQSGDLPGAARVLRDAVGRFPGNAPLRHKLRTVEDALAHPPGVRP